MQNLRQEIFMFTWLKACCPNSKHERVEMFTFHKKYSRPPQTQYTLEGWNLWKGQEITFYFLVSHFSAWESQEMHGKEKEMLESEAKEKVAKRSSCLEKVGQIQTWMNQWNRKNTNTDKYNTNTVLSSCLSWRMPDKYNYILNSRWLILLYKTIVIKMT